ncbi:hypothetical protein A3860_02120 [Niastella vici]|uniref:DUF1508 domain-containing protein n=1 Tax=Niastella vici TaxID=1703345 RepID=A0A1V9G961_9BACT|nr:hypothetical protein A3860_02120 [Niastella vici]
MTNDIKEDWWNKKEIPKDDLILEFKLKTGKQFWAYTFSDFLYKAKEILKLDIANKTLEEIEKISSEITDIVDDELASKEAFKYWKDENGFYNFSLYMANGLPILYSNPYLTEGLCLDTIEIIRKYGKYNEFYEEIARAKGDYFFRFVTPNGDVIARSIILSTAYERDLCIDTCKKISQTAHVIEVIR